MKNRFKKVVVLDTVIFYPEHEEVLRLLVEKPKIERVPLEYDQHARSWSLPESYQLPRDATIVMWPSSLPDVVDEIPVEVHERLGTAQCWAPAALQQNVSVQNLLNRVHDADCVITCWTDIPDVILDSIQPKAILTWTHEFEHRLNVEKARQKGIYIGCVDDYGTDAVAELELDGLLKLVERNKKTDEKARTQEDIAIGVARRLFDHYRKSETNERNTRKGRFTHQFHKLGQAQRHYGAFGQRSIDDIIPEKLLRGKTVGIIDERLEQKGECEYRNFRLLKLLHDGLGMRVQLKKRLSEFQPATDYDSSEFYKFLAENDHIVYDSGELPARVSAKIAAMKSAAAIDVPELPHYDETFSGKTLGIIGYGKIGDRVSRCIGNLGIKRTMYTGPRNKNLWHEYTDLDTLLTESDVVSVNVKAHKAIGLLSATKIKLIKRGVYFLNTSDGNAVDQHALTQRLLSNEVLAALDVYPGLPTTETLGLDDNPRGKIKDALPNHVITYRAGWITQESVRVKTYKLLGHMIEALQQSS